MEEGIINSENEKGGNQSDGIDPLPDIHLGKERDAQ
ncbi:Uncharacterised protein [Clostridium putrefaciens]|uniref:Uncharacterized protein n=1 Tax=Clostridium putrefaciens TaxID=99675 RepID=A0A381JC71_9CLOT|nr:Uncharacterised protein [Clostridium putrefaciens]